MKHVINFYKGNLWFGIFSTTSIVLLVASFVLPPIGVVDSSVLLAVSELFAWATLATVIKAIDKGIDAHITKGDFQIHLDNDDNDK